MRRLAFAFCCLAVACGGKEAPKKKDAPANTPATPEAPKKTPEELLCGLWASPDNKAEDKSLLQFKANGEYTYFVFQNAAWSPSDSKFTFDGKVFADVGDGQSYNVTISETELSLDNPTPEKQDFLKWRPAKAADCDSNSTATDCMIDGKAVPFACQK